MRIKQLNWNKSEITNVDRWIAYVMGKPVYEVGVHEKGGAYLMANWRGLSHDVYDNFEAAKQAAQEDFEARISQHLETTS